MLSRHLDNVKGESAESIPWNFIQNIATLQNTPERKKIDSFQKPTAITYNCDKHSTTCGDSEKTGAILFAITYDDVDSFLSNPFLKLIDIYFARWELHSLLSFHENHSSI